MKKYRLLLILIIGFHVLGYTQTETNINRELYRIVLIESAKQLNIAKIERDFSINDCKITEEKRGDLYRYYILNFPYHKAAVQFVILNQLEAVKIEPYNANGKDIEENSNINNEAVSKSFDTIQQCQIEKMRAETAFANQKFNKALSHFLVMKEIGCQTGEIETTIKILQQRIKIAEQNQKKYDSLLFIAQNDFDKGDLKNASQRYFDATQIQWVNTDLALEKHLQIQNTIQLTEFRTKEFNQILSRIQVLISEKSYDQALNLLQYVQTNNFNENQKQMANELLGDINLINNDYTKYLQQGKNALNNSNFDVASIYFEKAIVLFPDRNEPKQLLSEINLYKKHDEELKKRFEETIIEADKEWLAHSYQNAKLKYAQAIKMNFENEYASLMYKEVDSILKIKENEEEQVKTLLKEADTAFNQSKFNDSKNLYKKALKITPLDANIVEKINLIEQILLKQTENEFLDTIYLNLCNKGDWALLNKDYIKAKGYYTQAVNLEIKDQYANQRILYINSEMDKIYKEYNAIMEIAEQNLLRKNNYEALLYYSDALRLLPTATTPKEKIKLISSSLHLEKDKIQAIELQAEQSIASENYIKATKLLLQLLGNNPTNETIYQKIKAVEQKQRINYQNEARYYALLNDLLTQKNSTPIEMKGPYVKETDLLNRAVIIKINEKRISNELLPFEYNFLLQEAAAMQSENMATWQEVYLIDKGKLKTTEDRIKYMGGDFSAKEVVFNFPFKIENKICSYDLFLKQIEQKLSEKSTEILFNSESVYAGVGISIDENLNYVYVSIVFGN